MELNYWNYTHAGSILKCDLGNPLNTTQVLRWKDRVQKTEQDLINSNLQASKAWVLELKSLKF